MSSMWPFTCREDELAGIVHSDRSFVIAGAAGVGKSRLAAEAARRLSETHSVLRVKASEATRSLPLGAVAALLPAEAPPANLLGWAFQNLLDSFGTGKALLVVDDAHQLDPATAAVVHQLAGQIRVLATVRSGEPCPDPIIALWKDDLADRIELAEFTQHETEQALQQALGGPVDADAVARLHRLSRGNVLYLRELVLAGTVQSRDGRWRWRDGAVIGGWLAELIAARIGQVQGDQLRALELAVFAEPLNLGMLIGLTSRDAVEALEARQVVEVFDDGSRSLVRVAHPLYGEVVRANCPRLRTQRRFRELADATEAAGAHSREDRLRLALWRLESGTVNDPAPLLDACKLAWAAHDYPLAQRFGYAARDAGGGVEAALILASVLNYAERAAAAEAVLASVWDVECDERTRTLLALTRVRNLAFGGLGWQAEAERLLDEVEPTLSEPRNRQEMTMIRAVMAVSKGDFGLAHRLGDALLAEPFSRPMWAQAMLVRSWAQVYTGRFREGILTARQALAQRADWQDEVPPIVGSFNTSIIDAYRFGGELDALDAAIEQSYVDTGKGGGWTRGVYHDRMMRAIALRLRGRVRQAAQAMAETMAAVDFAGFGTVSGAELAIAAAQAGDVATASAALAAAQTALAKGSRINAFVPDLARHWVVAASGELRRAVELAVEAGQRLGALGVHAPEVVVLHDVVRLGGAQRVADRLAHLATVCEGQLVGLAGLHARAGADGDAAGLEEAARGFAEAGLLLHAAEAFAQASQAWQDRGKTASARASAARAWGLAARCDGAATPALARLRAPGLTTRELEIATLARAGLTSKQIADRFVVSTRTVDNHLRAIYTKLGISGRGELSDVLAGPLPGQQ